MKHIGKGIATFSIWAGVAGLSYLFHSFEMLSGNGAFGLVFGAFVLTATLWKID